MESSTICRLCLCQDSRMYDIGNTELQKLYETLTNVLLTADNGSRLACYVCHYLLRKCYSLQRQCIRANTILTELLSTDMKDTEVSYLQIESKKLRRRLMRSPMEYKEYPSSTPSFDFIKIEIKQEEFSDSENNAEPMFQVIKEESTEMLVVEVGPPPCSDTEDDAPLIAHNVVKSNQAQDNVAKMQINARGNTVYYKEGSLPVEIQKLDMLRAVEMTSDKMELENLRVNNSHKTINNTENQIQKENTITNNNNAVNAEVECGYFYCNECIYQSVLKHDLEKHMRFHDKDRPFACQVCGFRFTSKINMKRHTRVHTDNSSLSISTRKRRYVDKTKGTSITINDHKTYSCKLCTYECAQKSVLARHLLIHTGEKPFSCTLCSYKCVQKGDLKRHLIAHSSVKPFSCSMCESEFKEKSSLKRHMLKHTGNEPFSCHFCAYKCTQKSKLNRHLLVHTGEKPFACKFCSYKCTEKGKLNRHLLKHTGEKPFACKFCPYKSTEKASVKRHSLIHTNEKPFSCSSCSYKCLQKSLLTRHLLLHTGQKPFSCDSCMYRCLQKSDLRRHMLIHTDDKPFSCNLCPYKCKVKFNLKTHLLRHADK